jgi:predicted sugar kinase
MNRLTTLYEINKEANSILIKQLGLAKTIRFLNQFNTGKGDYTKLKDDRFQEKTVQEIVREIKKSDTGAG